MKRRLFIGVPSIIVILILFFWIENHSQLFHQCIYEQTGQHSTDNADKSRFIFARFIDSQFFCSIKFIDIHDAIITALAGIAVAAFTLTLKWSTDRLWTSGEKQHAITNRAFIFIEGFTSELTTATDKRRASTQKLPDSYEAFPNLYITRFAVQPRWKNSGNTPTRNMTIQTNWQVPDIERRYTFVNEPVPFFIGPQAVEGSEFVEITGTQMIIDHSFNPIGDEPLILFWGRGDYEDIFGGKHFIEWCYRLRYEDHKGEGLRASFMQWGPYNRSDEDDRTQMAQGAPSTMRRVVRANNESRR